MIADILGACVAEIRRVQAVEDQYIRQQQQAGLRIHPDPTTRASVDRIVYDMEQLARKLLTDGVGPFIQQ